MSTKTNPEVTWLECDSCGVEIDERDAAYGEQFDGQDLCGDCLSLSAWGRYIRDNFSEELESYEARAGEPFELTGVDRFLLVEYDDRAGYWLTTHGTAEDAARYLTTQEYPPNWTELHDLNSPDDRYDEITTFVKRP